MRLAFSLLFCLLLSGCGVSAFKPQNWNAGDTEDIYKKKNLELCRNQAQISETKPVDKINQGIISRSTNLYDNYNKSILTACMEAKGYKLRELSSGEILLNTVTAPIVLPIIISGRNFDDTY